MLSVVIATNDSERALVPTLAALVPGAPAGLVREVIVADACSRDRTATVADIAGCRIIVSGEPLGARLKAAAAAARSDWLLFLRPGVALDPSWIGEAERFIEAAEAGERCETRAATFRPAPPTGSERPALIEMLSLLRLSLGGRPRPEQGLLLSQRNYRRLGGHCGSEDAEADIIRRLGRRNVVMLRSAAFVARPV